MSQQPNTPNQHGAGEQGSPAVDTVVVIAVVSSMVTAVVVLVAARWRPVRSFGRSHAGHLLHTAGTVLIVVVVLTVAVAWLSGRHREPADQGEGEQGSAVLEAVIGAPLVILLLVTLIGAARVANAHQIVNDAAGDAARAASATRTTAAATAAAQQSATASMTGRGVSCAPMTVAVDTSNWRPGGNIGVTLTCSARLADLGIPILGGTRTVTGRAASVIDTYRQLGP